MPIVIETAFQITMDGSPTWKVAADRLKKIDDVWFVKLRAHDQSLINLVLHEIGMDKAHTPKKGTKRYSLAAHPGFKALLKLRNESVLELEAAEPDADTAAATLFDVAQHKKSKRPRLNASQLQDLRESPQVFELPVPGFGRPALCISTIRPAHPCDEMIIKLDEDSIEQCVHFIRNHNHLATRRDYNSLEGKGLWRNGSAGIVEKISEAADDEISSKRYKSHNKETMDEDCVPMLDQLPDAADGVAAD